MHLIHQRTNVFTILSELWEELACENQSHMDLLAYNLGERTVVYFLDAWDPLSIGSNTELSSAHCFSLACTLLKYYNLIFSPSELFPQAFLSWTLLSTIRTAIRNPVRGVFIFYQHHWLHKATYLLGLIEHKCSVLNSVQESSITSKHVYTISNRIHSHDIVT